MFCFQWTFSPRNIVFTIFTVADMRLTISVNQSITLVQTNISPQLLNILPRGTELCADIRVTKRMFACLLALRVTDRLKDLLVQHCRLFLHIHKRPMYEQFLAAVTQLTK